MKICTVCKTDKPMTDYYNYSNSGDGKCYRCKDCDNLARKKYLENNRESERKSARRRNLKSKYGITLDDYDKLLLLQGGTCAICDCTVESSRVAGNFAVDHCHTHGHVRGLLCNQCNRAIGMLDDDPVLLDRAAKYLAVGTFR